MEDLLHEAGDCDWREQEQPWPNVSRPTNGGLARNRPDDISASDCMYVYRYDRQAGRQAVRQLDSIDRNRTGRTDGQWTQHEPRIETSLE